MEVWLRVLLALTTHTMATQYKRVSITLPAELLRAVDSLRSEQDMSRSMFIRALLDHYSAEVARDRLEAYLNLVMKIYKRSPQKDS